MSIADLSKFIFKQAKVLTAGLAPKPTVMIQAVATHNRQLQISSRAQQKQRAARLQQSKQRQYSTQERLITAELHTRDSYSPVKAEAVASALCWCWLLNVHDGEVCSRRLEACCEYLPRCRQKSARCECEMPVKRDLLIKFGNRQFPFISKSNDTSLDSV